MYLIIITAFPTKNEKHCVNLCYNYSKVQLHGGPKYPNLEHGMS